MDELRARHKGRGRKIPVFLVIGIVVLVSGLVYILSASLIPSRLGTDVKNIFYHDGFPCSDQGTRYYSQGGVVVDGVAYFTTDHKAPILGGIPKSDFFPSAVSFASAPPFKKIRSYHFKDTYDSSPICLATGDGRTLVMAHEIRQARTRAVNVETGKTEWFSPANQPGSLFPGYACFTSQNGEKIILGAFQNGLHAFRLEDGKDIWLVSKNTTGGVTPCVDQENQVIYYQFTGGLAKIDSRDGAVIKEIAVPAPKAAVSWNTVLVNDQNGYFVATYWYGRPEWDSAIRVYDRNLALVWEQKGLPAGKKATLTYANGKLLTGVGNGWSNRYAGNDWKRLKAWSIRDGSLLWSCDLSGYDFQAIYNVPWFNHCFYAETQDAPGFRSKLFRIDETIGQIESVLDYGFPMTSCAPSIIARGLMFSGDILNDRIVVTRLAKGSRADWEGPFSDPRTNHNAVPLETGVTNVPMSLVKESD